MAAEKQEIPTIGLVSSIDGNKVIVRRDYAVSMSGFLSIEIKRDLRKNEFTLAATKDIMSLVVAYINHHRGIPGTTIPIKPLESSRMHDICKDPWDAVFIDAVPKPIQLLYDLVTLSNQLEMDCLTRLCCAKIASVIRGKPLEVAKHILKPHNHP